MKGDRLGGSVQNVLKITAVQHWQAGKVSGKYRASSGLFRADAAGGSLLFDTGEEKQDFKNDTGVDFDLEKPSGGQLKNKNPAGRKFGFCSFDTDVDLAKHTNATQAR